MTGRLLLAMVPAAAAVMVATSYVTIGILDTSEAESLWAPYAIVTAILAYANFAVWWGHRHGG